ncbi:ABC transporter substrate-binding protein [Paenibacillus sp. CCS19]|uniref:ABC transporter substrate-binding protein n=1 Tax=Paenibacillus sp. CCS19 TaxID=3158387 RepID=UPI00256DD811|nr:extracellular solute-binding protein [Paenibacillus cellulosilyticus]GMK39997.1 ABC transporter substrate-binding protein [Paenibacillus cellulosilyticus]
MNRLFRRGGWRIWPAVAALTLLFTGCSSGSSEEVRLSIASEKVETKRDDKPILRILSGNAEDRGNVETFEQMYGVNIEWISMNGSNSQDILAALDSSNPPDLIEFDYSLIRDLVDYDIFESLDLAPYDAKSVINSYFPGIDLSYFRSLDRQHVVFMPQILHANVTYYRADVMKEYGYPDDPEELGRYMESPERWLAMAKKLALKGKRIMQKPTDLLQVLDMSYGFFNNDGSFTRNATEFVSAIAIAKQSNKLGLPLGATIWEASGQEAIRNGELVMFTNGEWGDPHLQNWAQDSYRLWRTTRLPLNQYAIITGWVTAIPKESGNKDLAWKFSTFQLQRRDGYLKSLKISKWYDRLNEIRRTPLDAAASAIWDKELGWRINTDTSSDQIASTIESNIMSQLADRLELMSPLNARR